MARRIVNRVLYDTEKATWVITAGSPSNLSTTDHAYWHGKLYRTAKGNWFIDGDGGPSSMFSKRVGDASIGGSGIEPIANGDALRMLEDAGAFNEILKYFEIEEA